MNVRIHANEIREIRAHTSNIKPKMHPFMLMRINFMSLYCNTFLGLAYLKQILYGIRISL